MREPIYHRMTDYDHGLLPNAHLRQLEAGVQTEDEWRARTGFSIGYPGWGLLYYLTLCSLEPDAFNVVVETGTNEGASTIVLAQAILDSRGDGVVRTVEIDPDIHAVARENIDAAGVAGHVDARLGDSLSLLPSMLDGHHTVRVAFLDGNHLHDHVVHEFALVHPRLEPGAIVVFDNTYRIAEPGEDQRVFGALHTILGRYGGSVINLPYCSWYTPGLAVWQQAPFPD